MPYCSKLDILSKVLNILSYLMVFDEKIYFGYPCIVMKILEMNKKIQEKSRGILTKLLLSQLQIARYMNFLTGYNIKALIMVFKMISSVLH